MPAKCSAAFSESSISEAWGCLEAIVAWRDADVSCIDRSLPWSPPCLGCARSARMCSLSRVCCSVHSCLPRAGDCLATGEPSPHVASIVESRGAIHVPKTRSELPFLMLMHWNGCQGRLRSGTDTRVRIALAPHGCPTGAEISMDLVLFRNNTRFST